MFFLKYLSAYVLITFVATTSILAENIKLTDLIVNPSDGLTYKKFNTVPFSGDIQASSENLISGSYRYGLREGAWNIFYENGLLRQTGAYLNSKKDGLWSSFDIDGELVEEIHFTKGELTTGKIENWALRTIQSEIEYKNGHKVSEILYEYGFQDQLLSKLFYKNGKETKRQMFIWRYDDPDKLWYLKTYKGATSQMLADIRSGESVGKVFLDQGILHGPYESYSVDGSIHERGIFADGFLHGKFEIFYENGNLEFRETRYMGWKHGKRERFYLNGDLAEMDTFDNGVLYKNGVLAEGTYTHYYKRSGPKRRVVNYKDGLKQGTETTYHFDGRQEQTLNFHKGELLRN